MPLPRTFASVSRVVPVRFYCQFTAGRRGGVGASVVPDGAQVTRKPAPRGEWDVSVWHFGL